MGQIKIKRVLKDEKIIRQVKSFAYVADVPVPENGYVFNCNINGVRCSVYIRDSAVMQAESQPNEWHTAESWGDKDES